jgi:small redox-active disulfide protein 2
MSRAKSCKNKSDDLRKAGTEMIIEVCGMGCAKCHATKDTVTKVIQNLGLDESKATLVEVKDPRQMAMKGVMLTPAVLIDGKKVCEGKIPSVQEVTKWIEERR